MEATLLRVECSVNGIVAAYVYPGLSKYMITIYKGFCNNTKKILRHNLC